MSTPLARLAPKTLVPTGEGFGGHLRLEQCDVAYALAGMDNGPAALLRAMYAGDTGQGNMRDLYQWAMAEARRIGWEGNTDTLACRAVDELVYPRLTMCPHCGGAKSVQPNQHNPNGDCSACGNTGQRNPTVDEMAAIAGVSTADWCNVWFPRYVRIFGRLLECHAIAMAHVRDRLREDVQ